MTDHFARAAASIESTTRLYNDAVAERAPGVTLAESLSMSRLLVHMAQVAELNAQRVTVAEAPPAEDELDGDPRELFTVHPEPEWTEVQTTYALVADAISTYIKTHSTVVTLPINIRPAVVQARLAEHIARALVGEGEAGSSPELNSRQVNAVMNVLTDWGVAPDNWPERRRISRELTQAASSTFEDAVPYNERVNILADAIAQRCPNIWNSAHQSNAAKAVLNAADEAAGR